ncbi:MAG: hypothetical protein RLY43_915 [Bacteroidota bacterium]
MNAKEIFFKLKGSKQICEYNSDSNPIVANNYTY